MERNSYSFVWLYNFYRNSYSLGIVNPLRRGIGIPLKNERNSYSFPVGIKYIACFAQNPSSNLDTTAEEEISSSSEKSSLIPLYYPGISLHLISNYSATKFGYLHPLSRPSPYVCLSSLSLFCFSNWGRLSCFLLCLQTHRLLIWVCEFFRERTHRLLIWVYEFFGERTQRLFLALLVGYEWSLFFIVC
jgi:hypothetical protein